MSLSAAATMLSTHSGSPACFNSSPSSCLIYLSTMNLRAVQLLLGHTKLESTVRYLAIEVNDALEMAKQTEV
jgi:site-specific recombinase XerC